MRIHETTGLQNKVNRWYDPGVGRWISEDPIGFAGGDANLSRYVGNKTTTSTDSTGLVELDADLTTGLSELRDASDLAYFADSGYGLDLPKHLKDVGWFIQRFEDDTHTGLKWAIIRNVNDPNKNVLSFGGTEDCKDWKTNFKQVFGATTGQYEYAYDVAKDFRRQFGKANLQVTGHSKGGGVASFVAIVLNLHAVTFNAAGVEGLTVKRYGKSLEGAEHLIDAYRVKGELLSSAQDIPWWVGIGAYTPIPGVNVACAVAAGIGIVMPDGVGRNHWLEGKSWSPISRHKMPDVHFGLEKAIESRKALERIIKYPKFR